MRMLVVHGLPLMIRTILCNCYILITLIIQSGLEWPWLNIYLWQKYLRIFNNSL